MICDELINMREEEIMNNSKITLSYLDDWSKRIFFHINSCNKCQPERLNPEDANSVCDSLNTANKKRQ